MKTAVVRILSYAVALNSSINLKAKSKDGMFVECLLPCLCRYVTKHDEARKKNASIA